MYLVIDPACNTATGETPEKAVQEYIDTINDYDVDTLKIYIETNLKAKSQVRFSIMINSDGT